MSLWHGLTTARLLLTFHTPIPFPSGEEILKEKVHLMVLDKSNLLI